MRSSLCILGIALAGTGVRAAVPLPLGEAWEGKGIGGSLLAGPVWKMNEGFAPNHLAGQVWYHYRPDLLASTGIEMTDWNQSRTQSLFQTQYVGVLDWIPWGTSSQLVDVGLRLGGPRSSTTLDTLQRADPLADDSWDWQIGVRVGAGWNLGRFGLWASTGPVASWRSSGAASGWSMAQESEIGSTLDLRDFWNGARSYTRAWNLAVRIPVVYQPHGARFTRQGVVHRSLWSFGFLIGPSVLF